MVSLESRFLLKGQAELRNVKKRTEWNAIPKNLESMDNFFGFLNNTSGRFSINEQAGWDQDMLRLYEVIETIPDPRWNDLMIVFSGRDEEETFCNWVIGVLQTCRALKLNIFLHHKTLEHVRIVKCSNYSGDASHDLAQFLLQDEFEEVKKMPLSVAMRWVKTHMFGNKAGEQFYSPLQQFSIYNDFDFSMALSTSKGVSLKKCEEFDCLALMRCLDKQEDLDYLTFMGKIGVYHWAALEKVADLLCKHCDPVSVNWKRYYSTLGKINIQSQQNLSQQHLKTGLGLLKDIGQQLAPRIRARKEEVAKDSCSDYSSDSSDEEDKEKAGKKKSKRAKKRKKKEEEEEEKRKRKKSKRAKERRKERSPSTDDSESDDY